MKNLLFLSCLILSVLSSFSQDAREILKKSYAKCQSIKNGYYEMSLYEKLMDNKDTSFSAITCSFRKLKNDSLSSAAFHTNRFYNGKFMEDYMYTGNEYITFSPKDSTGEITSKAEIAKEISKSLTSHHSFYSPLLNTNNSSLPHDSDFIDSRHFFKFIGEEIVNEILCYRIQVNSIADNGNTKDYKVLRLEDQFWINKQNMIPVQYSFAIGMVMNNDTMFQYEKVTLNKYTLNNLKGRKILTLKSIPSFYKLKDEIPYKRCDLLPIDTIAPAWSLLSTKNENISLNDLKGQIVLIDFFYKGCYPCMLALPGMQSLYEKYKDKGLRVIGIDPNDENKDDLESFLKKRGITYPVMMQGKEASEAYHVSGYPTMYLVDRKGKILFIEVGYGENVEKTLEDIIKKNL